MAKKIKTHSGEVVYPTGKKRVRLHKSANSWIVANNEYYYLESGIRGGASFSRARLLLDTIKELPSKEAKETSEDGLRTESVQKY